MNNIKLMDEIEKDMDAGEKFYSLAMKIPLNNVLDLLIEGNSFIDSFEAQEEILNIICAEKSYLELGLKEKDIDVQHLFNRLEINLVKNIYNYVRNNIEFDLNSLHIHAENNNNLEINNKLKENFNLLKLSIKNNKDSWLMKCLAFKQQRNIIRKEEAKINEEIISKIDEKNIYIIFDN